MSACYSVVLKMYVEDEKGIIDVLNDYIKKETAAKRTNFSLNEWAKKGVYPDNVDGLMRIFLAGWNDYEKTEDDDGMLTYSSFFDACYGWETVMQDMFDLIIPYVSDISTFYIEPDNDYYTLGIKDGKSVVLSEGNSYEEEEEIEDEEDEDAFINSQKFHIGDNVLYGAYGNDDDNNIEPCTIVDIKPAAPMLGGVEYIVQTKRGYTYTAYEDEIFPMK